MSYIYENLCVLGCGLIGSSILRAAKAAGAAKNLIAYDNNPVVKDRVIALGLADHFADDLKTAVSGADLVIIAVPPALTISIAKEISPFLSEGASLSDVASTKAGISDSFITHYGDNVFPIPAHPIAGTEHSGPDAGFAEIFQGRWTILCPLLREDQAYKAALNRLVQFWQTLGSQTEIMTAHHHDLVLAVTSHLPHLIAYNIVGTAADLEEVTESEVIKFSASGFRDFTRIAASDPIMWRDIFLLNRDAVLEVLARFNEDLQALSRAIRWGEGEKLEALFTRTRAIRKGILAAGQDR